MIVWLAAKGLRMQMRIAFPSPQHKRLCQGMGAAQTQLFLPSAAILRSMATFRHLGKEHLAYSKRQQTFSSRALIDCERTQGALTGSFPAEQQCMIKIFLNPGSSAENRSTHLQEHVPNELLVCSGRKMRQFK